MEDLKNVQWPGDHNYNALDDSMYLVSTEKYTAPQADSQVSNKNSVSGSKGENGIVLPIVLGSVVLVAVIALTAVTVVRKKKQKT